MIEIGHTHHFNLTCDAYAQLYEERYGQPPLKLSDQDHAIFRGLINKHGFEVTVALLRQYFSMAGVDDDWFETNGHSVKCFQDKLLQIHSVYAKRHKQRAIGRDKLSSETLTFVGYLFDDTRIANRFGFRKQDEDYLETLTEPKVLVSRQELLHAIEAGDTGYPGLVEEIMAFMVHKKRGTEIHFDKPMAKERIQAECDRRFRTNKDAIGKAV